MGTGAPVKQREKTKRSHHAQVGTPGYKFATLAHETHGSLGGEAQQQIKLMADEACSHGAVGRSAFAGNLKTELSLATVKGNARVLHACTCQVANMTGEAVQKGASCPHAKVG